LPELSERFHGLERLFRLVLVSLEDKEEPLVVKEFSIVLDFMFGDVVIEFLHFFEFVLIVLNLAVVKEPGSFFAGFCFLFLFYLLVLGLLDGKNRYARGSNESSWMALFGYIVFLNI
jgi:hypothetical protein